MLLSILTNEYLPWQYKIGLALLMLPGLLIALIVHEIAHGFAAWKLGDPTAKNMGRLSFNPLHHLDLAGTAMLLLIGFGWAKPVPVNMSNFKKPRRDMALTALAGPLSNFLLALVGALIWGAVVKFAPGSEDGLPNAFTMISLGLQYFMMINIGLGLFNLIPIPPLDGSNILACVLPPRIASRYVGLRKYTQFIYYGLILLSLLANRIPFFAMIDYYLWFPLQWCRDQILNGFIWLVSLIFQL